MCFTCTTSSKVRSLEGGGVWVIENNEHFTVIVLQRRIRNFQCIHRSSRLQMIFKTGVLKISQISQENTCLHEEHLFSQENTFFTERLRWVRMYSGKKSGSFKNWKNKGQKQPSRCVLRKKCSENIQQIYRRTRMPKYDFNNVAK